MINKFKNTQLYITNFSEELAKLLKIEIGRNRRRTSTFGRNLSTPIDSTGRLRKNTEPQQIDVEENKLSVNIESLRYADFVDKGRKKGQKIPPVKDILQWIKDKPVRLRDLKGKIVKFDENKKRSLAYVIAKSISLYGIRPTNFISEAIDDAMKKLDTLTTPVAQDVMLNVEDILLKSGYIKKGDNFIIKTD